MLNLTLEFHLFRNGIWLWCVRAPSWQTLSVVFISKAAVGSLQLFTVTLHTLSLCVSQRKPCSFCVLPVTLPLACISEALRRPGGDVRGAYADTSPLSCHPTFQLVWPPYHFWGRCHSCYPVGCCVSVSRCHHVYCDQLPTHRDCSFLQT